MMPRRLLGALLLATALLGRGEVVPLSFDSASRAVGEVARAVGGPGRGLLDPYPALAAPFLFLLRHLPPEWRTGIIRWGMSISLGSPLGSFQGIAPEDPLRDYLRRYPPGPYPAVVLGDPSGGTAHLAALLGVPLLPPCYLLGVRHRISPDDTRSYVRQGLALGEMLGPREGFEVVIHYDPIHDRDLVARAALVRVRFTSLPGIYREFIREYLRPGGTIVLAEDRYSWPQVELLPGIWLQVGGLGAIPPEEYTRRYPLPGEPRIRRESEWGTPEGFSQAVEEFAVESGYRLIRIAENHPEGFSRLAFRAYRAAGTRQGLVILDCFTSMDARFCRRTGIAPLHLVFNTADSFSFALEELRRIHPRKIYLLLHPSFSPPPDLVPFARWREALGGNLEPLVDEDLWPQDPYAPFYAAARLAELEARYALETDLSLGVEALRSLLP